MTIAFTPGEPAGIGPDLAVIYAQKKKRKNLLVFTDPDVLLARSRMLGLSIKIKECDSSTSTGDICVFPIKIKSKVSAGVPNLNNSEFVLNTLKTATHHCLNGQCDALVTGPIHKSIINQAGFTFSGHTEYLAELTKTNNTVMMLATKGLRVALATTHIPLSEVPDSINTKSLSLTISIIHNSLTSMGLANPKIVVCGLNPHAGEDGFIGREEIDIINPLIHQLNTDKGYNLIGAVSADTAFTPDGLIDVDCVLAMYHDQGLTALKAIGFKKSANITLGLPFIRTSVDHGTALTLAGTGNISLGSFHTALDYAQNFIDNIDRQK